MREIDTSEGDYDFVVLGAGAGLAGALAAAESGLRTLVLERSRWVGGSTSLSGGTLWLPANALMRAAGVRDSLEAAREYLDALVTSEAPWCCAARRWAFLTSCADLFALLERNRVRLYYARGWTDYYAEAKGGLAEGRTLGAKTFAASNLGDARCWLRPSKFDFAAHSVELATLALGFRTLKSTRTAARVALRNAWGRIRGEQLLTRGRSLIAQVLRAALAAGATVWREASVQELIRSSDRVIGVRVHHQGRMLEVAARRGVLIATGGFANNAALRSIHQPLVNGGWSLASPDDLGDALALGAQVGAATGALDEAWWVPSTTPPGYRMGHVWDRCFPHSIIVDARGERFMNEAAPYVEAGQNMLRHRRETGEIRSWLILEHRHRARYMFGLAPPRVVPPDWINGGYVKKADTLRDLAARCGINPDRLARTVERFNGLVREGRDRDFGRGESAFSRYYGDSRVRPNPNLGAIDTGPFYAIAIYPGDVGTSGGLVADPDARVIDHAGQPIIGLYAAGNCAAPVFGASYPGAGATIAAAMVFALRAARHAASGEGIPR